MNRRSFLSTLATAIVVPGAPRRIYSFLWDNPLVQRVSRVPIQFVPGVYLERSNGGRIPFVQKADGTYVSTEPLLDVGSYRIIVEADALMTEKKNGRARRSRWG